VGMTPKSRKKKVVDGILPKGRGDGRTLAGIAYGASNEGAGVPTE
jgi:hypothetical protein